MPIDAQTSRDIEAWYRRRGLTPLLRNTGVGATASVRAAPFLVGAYVLVMMTVMPAATSLTPLTGLAVSVVGILASWVLTNLLRRQRPFARPRQVGWPESVIFVVAPVVPLLLWQTLEEVNFQGIPADEAWLVWVVTVGLIAGFQLLVLASVFTVVVFGLGSLSRWLAREVLHVLSNGASALMTTLPIVTGVVFFFFLNPGVWVTIGRQTAWAYAGVIALLLALAGTFLSSRAQFDLDTLARFERTEDLREALVDTPLANAAVALAEPTDCPLGPRERTSLRLVAVLSRLVIAMLIATAVFVFFLILGYLAVDVEAVSGWTRAEPSVLFSFSTRQHTYVLTAEHARVAGFLATFAAFNYSLASATDARLRHDISEAAEDMARQGCAVRLALLDMADPEPAPES